MVKILLALGGSCVCCCAQTTNYVIIGGYTADNVDLWDSFAQGFAFVFVVGIISLGARWVRRIIGGGSNE